MTPRARRIVENAYKISVKYGALKVGTEHILLAILEEKDSVAYKLLVNLGCDITDAIEDVRDLLRSTQKTYEVKKNKKESESMISTYGKNLTLMAERKQLEPVIGRDNETERLIRVLSRKTKNNPCLIGEAGVGKTAIVEGLAIRIATRNVPENLKNKKIISIDLTSMIAGAKYRGDFEERIKNLIAEVVNDKSIILFIDEIHTIVGAGAAEGAIDASNILKPQLSRAEIQLIGATTFSEYRKYIEKDSALERRFQPIKVDEPTRDDAISILNGIKAQYEKHHGIKISYEAITAAVELSEKYIHDRYLPDKAIDILDEACAKVSYAHPKNYNNFKNIEDNIEQIKAELVDAVRDENYSLAVELKEKECELRELLVCANQDKDNAVPTVTDMDIRELINEITGIPISGIDGSIDPEQLIFELKEHVVGQDEAIEQIVYSIIRNKAGLHNENRPRGVFLFIGDSGVGKTELAKQITRAIFYDEKKLIRYDMSEFSEKNSVTKLIGSPPGYVGYQDGGTLTEKVRRSPYSVILLDEIDKAHGDVLNLFLQIMDDGVISDSQGKSINFKNTYIIMTANGYCDSKEFSMGFLSEHLSQIDKSINEKFSVEFINRIDAVIKFAPISLSSMTIIAEKELDALRKKMSDLGVDMSYEKGVIEYLAKASLRKKHGVRGLKMVIRDTIENKLSSELLKGNLKSVRIEYDGNDVELLSVVHS